DRNRSHWSTSKTPSYTKSVSWQHHPVRQVKAALLSSQDLSVYSMNTPGFIPGIDFSDHLNYWQHDIPAIMITDTAFYRNKQYHLPGDTADRLNYQKMAQVVDGVITLLYNSK
ncbi:M28 family peptidase, partial [Escherichia coli]|uniref:M28 family peptidase n=1 Tax=Escherichia coli TaxID=562 RepID=UPI00311AD078